MNIKELRWLFLIVLAVAFFLDFITGPMFIGLSMEYSSRGYYFAAGTHPSSLALALIVIGLYLLLMYAPQSASARPLSGFFRRFVAFALDFWLAITLIAPVMGSLPVFIEWKRTGSFQWSFERIVPAPADAWMSSVSVALSFIALIAYFAFPLLRHRPSPGSCIMRYQIVPDDGITMTLRIALLRTLLSFFAAPYIMRNRKKGKFWVDEKFGTRAVMLD